MVINMEEKDKYCKYCGVEMNICPECGVLPSGCLCNPVIDGSCVYCKTDKAWNEYLGVYTVETKRNTL